MTDIDKLIEELEGAEEGSRELDVRIVLTLDLLPEPSVSMSDWQHKGDGKFRRVLKSDQFWDDDWFAEPYTTSVDAALGLAPEGWGCSLTSAWCCDLEPGQASATIGHPQYATEKIFSCDSANTLPLAICIAALKARKEKE